MSLAAPLTGQTFGSLFVLSRSEYHGRSGRSYWVCRCACGKERVVRGDHLGSGRTTDCGQGCGLKSLVGRRFGRLLVVAPAPSSPRSGRRHWVCQCDCGSPATVVAQRHLEQGHSRSCGCLRSETSQKLIARLHDHKYQVASIPGYRSLYSAWIAMIHRCHRPTHAAYKNYGGRGISVCERWRSSFEDFVADMGCKPSPSHSIDRIDNDGPYSPDNCRWATQSEQCNNQRRNRRVTFNGETLTITQWSRRLGVSTARINGRLRAGWPVERALSGAA